MLPEGKKRKREKELEDLLEKERGESFTREAILRQENDAIRKQLSRITFFGVIEKQPLASLEDLLERIDQLDLPSESEETYDLADAITAKSSRNSNYEATNSKVDMSKFKYFSISTDVKANYPYLNMTINEEALDAAVEETVFGGDHDQFVTFVNTFALALRKIRQIIKYHYCNAQFSSSIHETKHIMPMVVVLLQAMVSQIHNLTSNGVYVRGVLLSRKPEEPPSEVQEVAPAPPPPLTPSTTEGDTMSFQIKLVKSRGGPSPTTSSFSSAATSSSTQPPVVNKICTITGYTDVVLVSEIDPNAYQMIMELKLPGSKSLKPDAAQTGVRGQMFAEMLGFKARHADRSLYVGSLTDMFTFYLLLSRGGVNNAPVYMSSERNSLSADRYIKHLLYAFLFIMNPDTFPNLALVDTLSDQSAALQRDANNDNNTNNNNNSNSNGNDIDNVNNNDNNSNNVNDNNQNSNNSGNNNDNNNAIVTASTLDNHNHGPVGKETLPPRPMVEFYIPYNTDEEEEEGEEEGEERILTFNSDSEDEDDDFDFVSYVKRVNATVRNEPYLCADALKRLG